MRADMVVEPVIDIAKVIRSTGFGIETVEERAILDPQNDVVGHFYSDQIKTEEDLQNLHAPEIELNVEATALAEEKAHAIFDGILGVRMQGFVPWFAPWDAITTWRGAQNVLWDMADRPEFMYRLISKLADASHAQLDQLEAKGLLGYAQSTIHCTGAYSDELPAAGFDPQRPRATDLWTFGMAQIFSSVSPAMHLKYDIEFAIPWYERFGLGYYGCCEPLDEKIDIVRKIPHVRKVSMSPWVNQERGAEGLGRDLVFSRKPSPAFLATDSWEPEAVERDLRTTLETCRRHGCPVELILKDISTVRYQPQRLWEWSQIAARLVREG
jgi:hypothetical protein